MEERYEYIEGDKRISGGIYKTKKGKIILQSRYESPLNFYEKIIRRIFKK